MCKEESKKVTNVKLLIFHGVGCVTRPVLTCDNTHCVMPTRGAHPSVHVKVFTGASLIMIDQAIELSLQVN